MKNGWITDKNGTKSHYKNGQLHREDGPAYIWADGEQEWYINGQRHREDGPARIRADGTQEWYINNQRHREDGPARIWADGSQEWWVNDELHREDGPAYVGGNGSHQWWVNGQLHREDGPARIDAYGVQEWFVNDRLHREDGPAVIYANGSQVWYFNGVEVTEQIVMHPETLTVEQIRKKRNLEVRAIMVERFGWLRYLQESDAQLIDKRDNVVENTKEALYKGLGDRRLVVTCPTGRVFVLGVPSRIKTCEEAQKWLGNQGRKKINVIGRT